VLRSIDDTARLLGATPRRLFMQLYLPLPLPLPLLRRTALLVLVDFLQHDGLHVQPRSQCLDGRLFDGRLCHPRQCRCPVMPRTADMRARQRRTSTTAPDTAAAHEKARRSGLARADCWRAASFLR
jgi:hypothetical protein